MNCYEFSLRPLRLCGKLFKKRNFNVVEAIHELPLHAHKKVAEDII